MAMSNFKAIPANLKPIQPYLKLADEHEKRDPTISYWCRFYAVQCGLKLNDRSPENTTFFINLMEWLENEKKQKSNDESISNDVVAQAHTENYALKLFIWADTEDRAGNFNKNVVKAFYSSGILYDVVTTFGAPTDEVMHHKKYAKWKATYIHNCLKNGETPIAGPMAMEGEEDGEFLSDLASGSNFTPHQFEVNSNPAAPYPPGSNFIPQQPEGGNSNSTAPYPVGGLFQMPGYQSDGLTLPVPGSHAPPSTPSGSSQLSPTTSLADLNLQKSGEAITLRPEDYHKAQKYCKWAGSALQYEDVPTAVQNLEKALRLLTTGKDE